VEAPAHAQRGAASVEHVGLALLIALLMLAAVAALATGPPIGKGRELGTSLARKLRCAPRLPGPCWRDPLTEAYGRPLAGLVRALAPAPRSVGGLLPVDFRRCRSESCAIPGPRPGLTASNRRVTDFVSVEDRRASGGGVTVTYWEYRPGIGWTKKVVEASSGDVEATAGTPLLETDVPRLVALETLAGRNHYEFGAGEEPPWRWQVQSVYPD
jgi:hypothetical protein